MEKRVLKYFITVVEEKNISKAAQKLFITQLTLSRQMQELEEELKTTLFVRGNRTIKLTDDGKLFLKHAREILELFERTYKEFEERDTQVSGDVYIGCGESYSIKLITKTIKTVQQNFPNVHFHFFSGDAESVIDKFDKGLINFAVFMANSINDDEYDYIKFPTQDTWGLLMHKDNPLCEKEFITPKDIAKIPLINSQQKMSNSTLAGWFGKGYKRLNIVTTYNLIYNASLLVEDNIGSALTFENLIFNPEERNLCFRPLHPKVTSSLYLAWKKNQVLSRAGTE